MGKRMAACLLTGAVACSGSQSSLGVPDASTDVTTGTDGECSQSGATACDDVITAYCQGVYECCAPGGGKCTCTGFGCDPTFAACKAQWIGRDVDPVDCASNKYSRTVCAADTTACVDALPDAECSDILGGTFTWPTACDAFWGQYP